MCRSQALWGFTKIGDPNLVPQIVGPQQGTPKFGDHQMVKPSTLNPQPFIELFRLWASKRFRLVGLRFKASADFSSLKPSRETFNPRDLLTLNPKP